MNRRLMISMAGPALLAGSVGVGRLAAQEATPTVSAVDPASSTLLAFARYEELPAGPSIVSLVSINLYPGGSTERFSVDGPTIVVVSEGLLDLVAEAAVIGRPQPSELIGVRQVENDPIAADGMAVPQGHQVLIAPGSAAVLRNRSDAVTRLFVISIAPGPEATE